MAEKKAKKPYVKAGGVHAGHRSRMRKRFLATGLDGFQDHEVLEFLLYYAIPRRDVNETAHLLLNRFGTLSAVLDAPVDDLCSIPGVGPGTAHFLNLIPQVTEQMNRQVIEATYSVLRTAKDVEPLLAERVRVPLAPGEVLLVLSDRAYHVIGLHRYDSFDKLTIRSLALQTTASNASMCMFIENVPDCTDLPAPQRLQELDVFAEKLHAQMCPLLDYFAIDDLGNPPRSYAASGLLLPR